MKSGRRREEIHLLDDVPDLAESIGERSQRRTTMMDADKAKRIRIALEAALKTVEKSERVKLRVGRITYDREGSFTVKLEGGVVGADGAVASPEAVAFKSWAPLIGLKPEDLGRTFTVGGKTYKIEGYRRASRKRPIIAVEVVTDSRYVFPAGIVAANIKR